MSLRDSVRERERLNDGNFIGVCILPISACQTNLPPFRLPFYSTLKDSYWLWWDDSVICPWSIIHEEEPRRSYITSRALLDQLESLPSLWLADLGRERSSYSKWHDLSTAHFRDHFTYSDVKITCTLIEQFIDTPWAMRYVNARDRGCAKMFRQ